MKTVTPDTEAGLQLTHQERMFIGTLALIEWFDELEGLCDSPFNGLSMGQTLLAKLQLTLNDVILYLQSVDAWDAAEELIELAMQHKVPWNTVPAV